MLFDETEIEQKETLFLFKTIRSPFVNLFKLFCPLLCLCKVLFTNKCRPNCPDLTYR